MKTLLLSCLLVLPVLAHAQRPQNPRHKHELNSLYVIDQLYREALVDPSKSRLRDSIAQARHFPQGRESQGLMTLMVQTDSSNATRVYALLRRYGYPGKTLVGTPTNEAAFYVLQHSARIAQYLPLVERAAQQGELPFRLYAMMLDRHLMYTQQPQVYGTQGMTYTGGKGFICPIRDPAHVNKRRKKAGFDQTVEANAQCLGIEYQPLTLDDVKKMPGYQAPK